MPADLRFDTPIMQGRSTEEIIDGMEVDPGCIQVTGTEQYTFVGRKTISVFVTEPFDFDVLRPYLNLDYSEQLGRDKNERVFLNLRKAVEQEKPEVKEHRFRTWTDNTGKYTIEAKFSSFGAGKVTPEKKDGSKITIPMERLSAEDQEWVRALIQ